MKVPFLKKSAALAASVVALGLSSGAMAANLPFTLNPAAAGATGPTSIHADTLSGVSTELLHITAGGGVETGYLLFTAATLNGSPQFTNFKQDGGPAGQYNFYVKFQLTDTATGAINSVGPVTSLNFQMFLDPTGDDVFTPASVTGNTGTDASISNTANDNMLAFGTLISGVDGFDSLGGAFLNSIQTFDVCTGLNTATFGGAPVAAGNTTAGTNGSGCKANFSGFFVSPVPFYSIAFTGFNNNGNPGNIQRSNDGSLIAINSAIGNVSFGNVPEPSSIALFGIAAVGLVASARRRRSSK